MLCSGLVDEGRVHRRYVKPHFIIISLYLGPSATTRPRVAVPGETNLSTQVTTDTTVA